MNTENVQLNEDAILESIAFYNIFEYLHKKYYAQGTSIDISKPDFAIYSFPYVVNGSFACEMAIKSAINTSDSKKYRHHDLYLLFSQSSIDPEYKAAIKKTAFSMGLEEVSFDMVLHKSARLFENWRYHYEAGKNATIPKNFDIVVKSICLTMFKFSKLGIIDVPDK